MKMTTVSRFRIPMMSVACAMLLWAALLPAQEPPSVQRAATGTNGMVATAHPLATAAALEMLRQGGNAVDAAVAAAFVIGVVEPDGSGLGGGGAMLVHLADTKQTVHINYYQQAGNEVESVDYETERDRQSAKAAIIPGTAAGLTLALEKYGTLPLKTVLEPAVRHAEQGFAIDRTLAGIILDNMPLLSKYPETSSIYLDEGFPRVEGDTLRMPELAATLKDIAARGHAGFYEGRVAGEIAEAVSRHGGSITLEDLRSYQARVMDPVKGAYRGYHVYGTNVPQAGASIVQTLNMLEPIDLASRGHFRDSVATLHLFAEVLRRVYADRTAFLADPRFEDVPLKGILSKGYARERLADVDPAVARPPRYRDTKPGNPIPFNRSGSWRHVPYDSSPLEHLVGELDPVFADAAGQTTHICVVDGKHNAVSLTQTLGTFFGSGLTAAGVLLNNSRTNFSRTTRVNSLAPGKQPRSAIAPTMVFKDDKLMLVLGSPGATRIVSTVTQLIVNVLDFGMTAEQANNTPRFFCQKFEDYLYLESRYPEGVQSALKAMGHTLQVYGDFDLFFGGAQVIRIDPSTGTMEGSADPRRGGSAAGI